MYEVQTRVGGGSGGVEGVGREKRERGKMKRVKRTLGRIGHMDGQATANAVVGAPSMLLPVTQLQPHACRQSAAATAVSPCPPHPSACVDDEDGEEGWHSARRARRSPTCARACRSPASRPAILHQSCTFTANVSAAFSVHTVFTPTVERASSNRLLLARRASSADLAFSSSSSPVAAPAQEMACARRDPMTLSNPANAPYLRAQ